MRISDWSSDVCSSDLVSVQGEVLNLLARLQDEIGLSILMVTHNLNVVRHVADRVAIMYLGRFVETGPTEDVFRQPRHPYTAALLSANPESDPDARMARIELQGDVRSEEHTSELQSLMRISYAVF